MNRCFFCGTEVPHQCPNCQSEHVRVGAVEFWWGGVLAKKVEVAWCKMCDLVWFLWAADGGRAYICAACRKRALRVVPDEETAAELATSAAA